MKRRQARKTSRNRKDVVARFTWGRLPEEFGEDDLTLALDSAGDKWIALWGCRTWGEYARLCGYTWKGMLNEWGEEIEAITGTPRPLASHRLRLADSWGNDGVASILPDPRQAASDLLLDVLPVSVRHATELEGRVTWWPETMININVITAGDELAVQAFSNVIERAGFDRLTFERDDRRLLSFYRGLLRTAW